MTKDVERIAAEQAPGIARELLAIARRGGTEADFRREVARVLEQAGAVAGLELVPRDEFTVARGRVDSVYNRLVLEYKRPGVIRPSNSRGGNKAVIDQMKDYVLDVAKKERREAHRLAGVATDGHHFLFVRRVGDGWSIDEPVPVAPASTERFLRLLYALSAGRALVPENLVEDFGPKTLQAQRAIRALYKALHGTKHPLVAKLFEQWRLFFSEATDYREWADTIESKPEFRAFVGSLWSKEDIKHLDAARVFFVLHTYYAVLIKLIASMAAARFGGGGPSALAAASSLKADGLRAFFKDMEGGGIFRHYGIRNFLEGDFFGWYLVAWNDDVEAGVSSLVQRLAAYDPGTIELAPENARDLLKKLYHNLLPREIRHDLGEYYTPDWLAERLIRQTLGEADLGDPSKRVLDPACGSGTFLVLLIKHVKERAARMKTPPRETLASVLQNIVGIDLNPLAVIAARTNYLLALGDLIKSRDGDIDIPVYQADSVLTPSRGSDLFEGEVYPLKTSAGVFRIPARLNTRERMDALANTLDDAADAGIGDAAFLARAAKEIGLGPEEAKEIERDLGGLYRQLRELHQQGLNGVWARIIKNAFAPLFLEPCHYVIGNPPWVNWESLPDDYRLQTKPLWEHYGLFPHGGMDTILGKGKKDISMLMTYVAADRYLRRGGKLGFVVSQSLFKTTGSGQGFRRFVLPDKTSLGPIVVEDMVALKPFEGATNRTAILVFRKGQPVRYPVAYSLWRKRAEGRGSSIGFDTPYEEVTAEKITFRKWAAEPVDSADATSAWLTARPKALRALRSVLGRSAYEAHAGTFTGGANGVYWVEVLGQRPGGLVVVSNITEGAKRKVARTQAAVEDALLYPLLRGRDVNRWVATPSAHILMTQDPKTRSGIAAERMEKDFPKAHSYLARFESMLRKRAAFKRYFKPEDPYWSMFNVSGFTLARWKVVWREQASSFMAAVMGTDGGKTVMPDHKLMMVEVQSESEAHFLCAALNSVPVRAAIAAYAVDIQMDTHVLANVSIPAFVPRNPVHSQLVDLSKEAHRAARSGDQEKVLKIEEPLAGLAASLWKISREDLIDIRQSLEES